MWSRHDKLVSIWLYLMRIHLFVLESDDEEEDEEGNINIVVRRSQKLWQGKWLICFSSLVESFDELFSIGGTWC